MNSDAVASSPWVRFLFVVSEHLVEESRIDAVGQVLEASEFW